MFQSVVRVLIVIPSGSYNLSAYFYIGIGNKKIDNVLFSMCRLNLTQIYPKLPGNGFKPMKKNMGLL